MCMQFNCSKTYNQLLQTILFTVEPETTAFLGNDHDFQRTRTTIDILSPNFPCDMPPYYNNTTCKIEANRYFIYPSL